jgi:drug/metabolite transporter (DMT)-like permease
MYLKHSVWEANTDQERANVKTNTVNSFTLFLMFLLVLFWGSSFVVVKVMLRGFLTPIAIATFRFLIAGSFFIITILFGKKRIANYKLLIETKDIPILVLLALTGVTFFFPVQYTGIQMAGASTASILACLLSPVLIAMFSAILFKERLLKKQVLGIGIATVGTFAVVTNGTVSFRSDATFFFGSLLLLVTPFLWATYSLLGKKVLDKYNPFLVAAYVTCLGGLLLVPFSLVENSFCSVLEMSLYEWVGILFLSVTCSLLGYYIYFYVMKQVSATITSSFLFVEPLITALLAVAFVGEVLNLFIIAGGLLIFVGVYLVAKK